MWQQWRAEEVSRSTQRTGFTVEQRIQLAETDIDEIESGLKQVAKSLNRMTFALVGAIISFATSAVILAWQISLAKH